MGAWPATLSYVDAGPVNHLNFTTRMPSDNLAAAAGPTGVGALCILSAFLFLDGRAPSLFPTVEFYAKTATWGIVAAVPVLVISYIIGLFVITGAELIIQPAFGPSFSIEAGDLARVGGVSTEKSALVQAYVQLRQDRGILGGSSLALLLLGIGALSEIPNLLHLRGPIIVMAILTFLLAGATFYFAGMKSQEAHVLAQQVLPSSHNVNHTLP